MNENNANSQSEEDGPNFQLCTASQQISRDHDVKMYTGLQNTEAFKAIFAFLYLKAARITYWKGKKQTSTEKTNKYDSMDPIMSRYVGRWGIPRKLTLEQELLLVMM